MRYVWLGCAIVGVVLSAVSPSFAHHGKEYLRVETPHIPAKGTFHFFSTLDWKRRGREKHFETIPAVMYAFSDRLALELHGHFSDEDGGLRLEAIAPELRFKLPTGLRSRWLVGLTAEFEKARIAEAHDEWQTRFVLHRDGRRSKVTLNLIASKEVGAGEPLHYGVALGWHHQSSRQHAFAVELLGDFNGERRRELLPSWQVNIGRGLIKVGLGFGLTQSSPDLALRTGFVLSF